MPFSIRADRFRISYTLASTLLFSLAACAHIQSRAPDQLSTTESFSPAMSVVRIYCKPGIRFAGTGFMHKSGGVITASQVARDCGDSIEVLNAASGQRVPVINVRRNDLLDLAILSIGKPLDGTHPLSLSMSTNFLIGSRVSMWGFPLGYDGSVPLLSVGHLAGVDQKKCCSQQWIINGAFNLWNSGGPVLSIEDGSVIGVLSSKLAPFPPGFEASLKALSSNRDNLKYQRQRLDGTLEKLSDAQIVAEVLGYLRMQIPLTMGYAVSVKELRQFLKDKGIEP